MIKPLLFIDFDGTICHDRFWRSLPAEQYTKVQALLFNDDTTRVQDWMRGKYTAEEINAYVAKEIGMPSEVLWSLFVNDCTTMSVPIDVLEKINALGEQYTTILMTANMDSFTRFTVPSLSLRQYFDHISNSYDEGLCKTDEGGKLFLDYAHKYNVPFQDCLMIDDSEHVCSIVETLGGTALRITPHANIYTHLEALAQTH